MRDVGRPAAATSLIVVLLLQAAAVAALAPPATLDAHQIGEAAAALDRAAECPDPPASPRSLAPARERAVPHVATAAETAPALRPGAAMRPAHHARSHPAARGIRSDDPAPS